MPDGLSAAEVEPEFRELLADQRNAAPRDIAEALLQLADRQWHTYEPLDTSLQSELSSFVLKIWDEQDVDIAGALLACIGHLGLGDTFRTLTTVVPESRTPEVQAELDEAQLEFGETVDDPYRGMQDV